MNTAVARNQLEQLKYNKYTKKCKENAQESYLRHEHECFMKWRRVPRIFSGRPASHQSYKMPNPLLWVESSETI